MKKYLPIIVLFLIIVSAAIYFSVSLGYTQHYDDGEISFDYPQDWSIEPGSNPSQVVLFRPSSNSNITINKQVIPPGYQSPENYILNTTEAHDSGFRLTSHRVKNLNMDNAYENTYYIDSNGSIYLRKEVWIPKNGNLYSIIYTQHVFINGVSGSGAENGIIGINPYDNQDGLNEINQDTYTEISNIQMNINYFDLKSSIKELAAGCGFEIIMESFQVESVLILADTPFWGDVSIPALNVSWGIRSDSVNGYNSVYYYSESFYPDRNGTMGLLGHRTSYSAPFRYVDQLKVGDEVVINDYLTQKKYIYQVVSNGDINWDYLTDPIRFHPGNNNLTLVTCHPPGTINGAWMVHCKLISIEPLN